MTNSEIKQVLKNNNVLHLYHTNTVETSISFLCNKGLLSRGLCEDISFPQTGQYTDTLDQEYNIYYDIFLTLLRYNVERVLVIMVLFCLSIVLMFLIPSKRGTFELQNRILKNGLIPLMKASDILMNLENYLRILKRVTSANILH